VLKAAMRGGARASADDAGVTRVAFDWPGRFTATAYIAVDGLVRRVESTFADPVLGDTPVVTTYDDYRAVSGIQFPMRVRQTMGSYPVLDLTVTEVQVNPSLAMAIPDAARNVAERVTSEKVAEGVWYIAGGSHNSALIELPDRLILVETPLNDARRLAVIEHVKTWPRQAVRIVVGNHQLRPAGQCRGRGAPPSSPRPTTCPSSSVPSPGTIPSSRRHGGTGRAVNQPC
jgi:hypothetical protein